MANDYDVDLDDLLDMGDDGWLYVEDEFDLADELAEGQLANPGYSGTNYEIDLEAYEFDLFGYWDDLEYADDAYWDSTLEKDGQHTRQKRKRGDPNGDPNKSVSGKRQRTQNLQPSERDAEPLLFLSREERNRLFFRPPPRLKGKDKFAFLADWEERFANEDGTVLDTQMPAAMRRAAEGQDHDMPQGKRLTKEEGMEGDVSDEEEWEDEDDNVDEQGGLSIDPEMLKAALQDKLGATGLGGLDEATLMQTIQKMLLGQGDDAAGDLATALLGKVTSDAGDDAVSGWLSQQGVSLEMEDEGNAAEGEEDEGTSRGRVQHTEQQSWQRTQMPLHSGSPSATSKKRAAPNEVQPGKKQKKVKFDVPPLSSDFPELVGEQDQEEPTSDDPLMSERTISKASNVKVSDTAASKDNRPTSAGNEEPFTKRGRKRKVAPDEQSKDKPAAKKTRSKELVSLCAVPDAQAPSAPPAKRTRSAKAKSGR